MKYPYNVKKMQVEGHVFWVAISPLLKGCVGQGDTLNEAIAALEANEEVWLETAVEFGIEIPEIPVEEAVTYSGKFMVRISSQEHKKASELAKKQGVSLNQYVNDAIVARNAECTLSNSVSKELSTLSRQINSLVYRSNTTTNAEKKYSLQTIINTRNKFTIVPA